MPTIKLAETRNTPHTMQGTQEPIKVKVSTVSPATRVPGTPQPKTTSTVAPVTNQVTPHNNSTPNQSAPVTENTESQKPQSPSPAEDPLLSSKFAALARKEKAIRQRQIEIQQKEAEMSKLNEEIAKERAFRARLKDQTLDVLQEEGITYDKLVQKAQATVDPNVKQVLDLEAKIAKLEEALNKQQEESQKNFQSQREQAVKQISMDVKSLIDSNPAYETVKDFGYDEAVTELIVQTYDEDGVLLTTDQAAKQVEEYLKAEVNRITSRPSVKKILTPANEAQQPQGEVLKTQPTQTTTSNTLSRSMAPLGSNKPLRTTEERRRDAILAAQGKLTKG